MTTKNLIDKKLSILFENGTTASGAVRLKAVSFPNLVMSATDDDIYAAATAYAALTTKVLDSVRTSDINELTASADA